MDLQNVLRNKHILSYYLNNHKNHKKNIMIIFYY